MLLRILGHSLLLATTVHGVAWACSCIPHSRTPEEEMVERELIAWGTVLPEAEKEERWLLLLAEDEALSACNPSHPAEDGDKMLEAFRALRGR